jgi:predicted transcriptional regulator
MKNIFVIGLIALAFSFTACDKEDAAKDVDYCIKKLNQFNTEFAEMYEDGLISKDTIEGEENSEYDQIKKLASQYYELVNKINSNIEEEKELAEKGKKTEGYEEAYNQTLKEREEDITKAVELFEENLKKLEGEKEEAPVEEIETVVDTTISVKDIDSTEIEIEITE